MAIIPADMSVHVVLSKIRIFVAILLLGSSLGCSSQSRGGSRGYEGSGVRGYENSDSCGDADSIFAPLHPRTPASSNIKDTLTFAFVGDIMMGTTFPSRMLPADEGRNLFRDAKDILSRADIAAGNLEGTLCDGGQTKKKVSSICYAFRTPTSYSHLLKEAGFDFLGMANNHANDFGLEGIVSTEKELDAMGIGRAGIAGRQEYAILEIRGDDVTEVHRDENSNPASTHPRTSTPSIRVGFCAFGHNSYTITHTDTANVSRILKKLRSQVDLLVVCFHGGAEGAKASHLPQGKELFLGENRGSLRQFAHQCIDLGADIVYGHGPHVPRCIELYNDKLIAYSLGNFCTPKSVSLKGISGYAPLLEVKVDGEGRFLEGKIHSFIQQPAIGPRLDGQHRAAQLIRDLSASDIARPQLTISSSGDIRRR